MSGEMQHHLDVVAVDMGAGAFKVTSTDGKSVLVLAQVALEPPHLLVVPQLAGLDNQRTYHNIRFTDERGTPWHLFVGAGAYRQGRLITALDHYRFRGRADIRALLYASIAELLYQSFTDEVPPEVHLHIERMVVGLPLESWRQSIDEPQAEDTPRLVQKWLAKPHHWEGRLGNELPMTTFHLTLGHVQVVPQAMGAAYDLVIDENYTLRYKLRTRRLGIISLGFNTIDIMAIEEGKANDLLARSQQNGVRHLLRQYDRTETFAIHELDEKVRRRQLELARLAFNVRIWLESVDAFIASVWDGNVMRRFDDVIVTGGGVALPGVREHFASHPLLGSKVRFPDDPVFCISRGLCKIGVLSQRRVS